MYGKRQDYSSNWAEIVRIFAEMASQTKREFGGHSAKVIANKVRKPNLEPAYDIYLSLFSIQSRESK